MNEKLEKLNRQKTAAEKKLIAAQHREKQLEHERKRLTRSERTHRLCTRAGMLEKFLREPMAEDVYQFIRALELERVTYYGFSDGGIIGLLLASRHPGLLDKMIISGANTRPDAVRKWLRVVFKIINRLHQNPLFTLMLTEPHISGKQLQAVTTPTLVLAGSKDLVVEADTRFIAEHIPHATLQILEGEGHASYIVHQTKVAELILIYCGNH